MDGMDMMEESQISYSRFDSLASARSVAMRPLFRFAEQKFFSPLAKRLKCHYRYFLMAEGFKMNVKMRGWAEGQPFKII
jgi:hypothetical protein